MPFFQRPPRDALIRAPSSSSSEGGQEHEADGELLPADRLGGEGLSMASFFQTVLKSRT